MFRTANGARYFGPLRWSLIALVLANPSGFRRWDLFIISILALLVLAVYIAAVGAGLEINASATSGYTHPQKEIAPHRAAQAGG